MKIKPYFIWKGKNIRCLQNIDVNYKVRVVSPLGLQNNPAIEFFWKVSLGRFLIDIMLGMNADSIKLGALNFRVDTIPEMSTLLL